MIIFWALYKKKNENELWLCMISLLKFEGIGLFTCEMAVNDLQLASVNDLHVFFTKKHVLLLTSETRKFRQVRWPPPLFGQKSMIKLNEILMKNYFEPKKAKNKEKVRNPEKSKIMTFAWKFRHFHFPCQQETEKMSKMFEKSFDFLEKFENAGEWKLLKILKSENTDESQKCWLILLQSFLRLAYSTFYNNKGFKLRVF